MARTFTNASNDWLRNSSTTGLNPSSFSATGCTAAAWHYPTDVSSSVWHITVNWPGFGEFGLDRLSHKRFWSGNVSSYLGAAVPTVNVWWHAAMTVTSAGVLQGYANGVGDGARISGQNFGNFNEFWIGSDGTGDTTTGRVADVAVWSVVLTPAEISALAQGRRPRSIRPASLIGYWPVDGLVSPEPDFSGLGNNLTLTGTPPYAPAPPLAMFTPRWPINIEAAAAAPSTIFRKSASRIGTRTGTRQTWAA